MSRKCRIVLCATEWLIWKWRNEACFAAKRTPASLGWQSQAVQRGGERSSGRLQGGGFGLEQTQAAQRVDHRGPLPGPVQVHSAVSDLPQEIAHFRNVHVPVAAPGFFQQVFPASEWRSLTLYHVLWVGRQWRDVKFLILLFVLLVEPFNAWQGVTTKNAPWHEMWAVLWLPGMGMEWPLVFGLHPKASFSSCRTAWSSSPKRRGLQTTTKCSADTARPTEIQPRSWRSGRFLPFCWCT